MKNTLIKYMLEGKTQVEIAALFKASGVKPNSLSSIEKYLQVIKKEYNAKTMFHLGVILSKGIKT